MHINTSQLDLAEFARNQHTLIATTDQSLEDIMEPAAWAHSARTIRPRDRIEVIAEDHSWMAELFVVSTSKQWVKTQLLKKWEFKSSAKSKGKSKGKSKYEVQWRGPSDKFSVLRISDKSIMQTGFDDKDAAEKHCISLAA